MLIYSGLSRFGSNTFASIALQCGAETGRGFGLPRMGTMTVSVMQYPAVGHGPQQTPALGFPAASLGSEQKGAEDFAGTALATVLDGLRNWTIFAGVDWSSRSKAAVPFPRAIDEQDIAKVTAYSAGVPQLHYLADLVKLENPREAYPPLVCLAAMVRTTPHSIAAVHPSCKTAKTYVHFRIDRPARVSPKANRTVNNKR